MGRQSAVGAGGGYATGRELKPQLRLAGRLQHGLAHTDRGQLPAIHELIAQRTGKSVEQIEADSDRDHWFSAQEALEYGFVDRVISSPVEIGNRAQEGEN